MLHQLNQWTLIKLLNKSQKMVTICQLICPIWPMNPKWPKIFFNVIFEVHNQIRWILGFGQGEEMLLLNMYNKCFDNQVHYDIYKNGWVVSLSLNGWKILVCGKQLVCKQTYAWHAQVQEMMSAQMIKNIPTS